MNTSQLRRSRLPTLGLALLMSGVAAALASPDQGRLNAACAAYDVHVLTLIDDHGLVGQTAPEVLSGAASQMLEARVACRQGEAERALELYGSIPLANVPSLFHPVLLR